MSYRSDGAYRIVGPKEALLARLLHIQFTAGDDGEDIREAIAACTVNDYPYPDVENLAILGFSFEQWKWDTFYPTTRAHQAIWRSFYELAEENFSGAMIVLGEDDGDIQKNFFGEDPYDLVSVHRSYDAAALDSSADLRSTLESSKK